MSVVNHNFLFRATTLTHFWFRTKMASSMSPRPLRKESSIEVIPRSSPASSELTYALIKERTRSSKRLTSEAYLSSLANVNSPPTPFVTPSAGGPVLAESYPVVRKTPSVSLIPKPSSEEVASSSKMLPADKIEKEETSSASSEKENNMTTKARGRQSRRKGIGSVMRFLRTKPVQSKPPKVVKKKSVSEATAVKIKNKTPAKDENNNKRDVLMDPATEYISNVDTPIQHEKESNAKQGTGGLEDLMTTPVSDEEAMEKAKEYTLRSMSLLDSLKNDDGGDDIHESIQQAKLAYEYAMTARQLYNSVRCRSAPNRSAAKALCDDSVNSFSVASSHITEKAGNTSAKNATSLFSKSLDDSSAIHDVRAETPLSSLLLDNEAPVKSNAHSTSTSIEIEHDGMIRFEAPATTSSQTMEGNLANSELEAVLQVTTGSSTAKGTGTGRTLSPLSKVLGESNTDPQKHSRAMNGNLTNPKIQMVTEALISKEALPIQSEAPKNSSADIPSVHDADFVQAEKPQRVRSNIIHPPALRFSVSASDSTDETVEVTLPAVPLLSLSTHDAESIFSEDTTPSQKLLIRHQENRMKERMKEIQFFSTPHFFVKCGSGLAGVEDRETALARYAFEVETDTDVEEDDFAALQEDHRKRMEELKFFTGSDLVKCNGRLKECVDADNDLYFETSQKPKTERNLRIIVVNDVNEHEKEMTAHNGHKLENKQPGMNHPSLWQRVRSSSQAAKEWTREEYDALNSQLKEVTILAEDIMNGEVFVCSSAASEKRIFDDDTYATYSEASDSLTDGPLFTDDETYDGTLGTASTWSNSGGRERVEAVESNSKWEATWDDTNDESSSGSESSYTLPQEMTVLGYASDYSDESSQSDDSTLYRSDSDSVYTDEDLSRKRIFGLFAS